MIISLATLIVLLMMAAIVLFTYDDEGETATPAKKAGEIVGFIAPQYGGIPVYINQKIHAAKEIGDREAEGVLVRAQNKLFRNRRSPEDKSAAEIDGKRRFIKKYGEAGALAIRYDEEQKRLATLTPEEQSALIAAQLPKPKARKKAGGK